MITTTQSKAIDSFSFMRDNLQELLDEEHMENKKLQKNYIDFMSIDINDNIPDRSKILCFIGTNKEGPVKIYVKASSLLSHFHDLVKAQLC